MRTQAPARVAIGAIAIVLLWRIVQVNVVLYGDANHPMVRIPAGAAEAFFAGVLRDDPAEVGALAAIGSARLDAGDRAGARRVLAAALDIAPVDPAVLRASAALELADGRVGEAIAQLDRVAESRIAAREWIFPLFAQVVAARADQGRFAEFATRGAGWMGAFLAYACQHGTEPLAVAAVLVRRIAAGHARPDEIACVTDRLRAVGQWDAAYQLWLNSLPRERLADVGFVFNGGFEYPPSGLGFDWIALERSAAFDVDFPTAQAARGERALRATFSGKRLSGAVMRQYLALAPGSYRFEGLARMEGLQSVRGLQWVVRCAFPPAPVPLASSERLQGTSDWRAFEFDLVVDARCMGQVLELEPAGVREGTTYVAGKAWFDGLRLTRAR